MVQFKLLKKKYKHKMINNVDFNLDRILIIVPHADDELIGCHEFIRKHKKNVLLFYCGMLGINLSKQNKLIRQKEFINYCKSENILYKLHKDDIYSDIKDAIISYKPNVIFLPSYVDWHKEHRLVNEIVNSIFEKDCLSVNMIGWYQITVPINKDFINYSVSMSRKAQNEKWKRFRTFYNSQWHLPIRRFKYSERLCGLLLCSFSAEVFTVMEVQNWKKYLNILRTKQVLMDIRILQNKISNLQIIDEASIKIFKQLFFNKS